MQQEDQLYSILSSNSALSFIDDFLKTFPNTGLYLVGGAVRDVLLGRHMREADFDFVITRLSSDALENWFAQRGEINLVGQHFGVYKFLPHGFSTRDMPFIDIALPRTEHVAKESLGGYRDFDIQSNPELPIEEDLARRDFTINAMAFDIRSRSLIDPFDGQKDLALGLIRAVGNPSQRFTEDLSRILRGIRLCAELDFRIETHTTDAMRSLIPNLNLQKKIEKKLEYVVPREVVGEELTKAIDRNPVRAMEALRQQDGFKTLFPEVHLRLQKDLTYLAPIFHARPGELTLALALLLRDFPLDIVRNRLHANGLDTLPRNSTMRIQQNHILWIVREIQTRHSAQTIKELPANQFEKRFMNGQGDVLIRALEILEEPQAVQAAIHRRNEIEHRWLVDHDEAIAPLLSGQDVLAQGVKPGPEIRQWLDLVRDEQLEGRLMRREEALKWLEQQI